MNNKKFCWLHCIVSKIGLMITQLASLTLVLLLSTVYLFVSTSMLTTWSKEQLLTYCVDIWSWAMEFLEGEKEWFCLKRCCFCFRESSIVWLTESTSIFLINPTVKVISTLTSKRNNTSCQCSNKHWVTYWLQKIKKDLKMFC